MPESPKRQKADIVIGSSSGKVTYTDTSTEFGVNSSVVLKSDLAAVCKCGTEDKCWAIILSCQRLPWSLSMCNHAGEPGHESGTSSKHTFANEQYAAARALVQSKHPEMKLN